jgi:hypothetical protein
LSCRYAEESPECRVRILSLSASPSSSRSMGKNERALSGPLGHSWFYVSVILRYRCSR